MLEIKAQVVDRQQKDGSWKHSPQFLMTGQNDRGVDFNLDLVKSIKRASEYALDLDASLGDCVKTHVKLAEDIRDKRYDAFVNAVEMHGDDMVAKGVKRMPNPLGTRRAVRVRTQGTTTAEDYKVA